MENVVDSVDGTDSSATASWLGEKGVVLTPPSLVDMMVSCAVQFLPPDEKATTNLTSLRWLDPAVGDGAFVIGILKYYVRLFGDEGFFERIPRILAVDRSEQAILKAKSKVLQFLRGFRGFDGVIPAQIEFLVGDSLLMFPDEPSIFAESFGEFDVVIGNPPYIRHSQLSLEERFSSRVGFPTLAGGMADYFTFFFGAAINAARLRGIVAFVTPASFIKNQSGTRLRNRIHQTSSLSAFIDLDELPIFENASVHTAISILQKGSGQSEVRFKRIREVSELSGLGQEVIDFESRTLIRNETSGWHFLPLGSQRRTRKTQFQTLEELNIRIRSGVRSGAASIFILGDEMAAGFPEYIRERWLRKLVVPTDIQKYDARPSKWLIWTNRSAGKPPREILEYLEPFKEKLIARPEVLNGATEWFGLRPLAYSAMIEGACIVSPDICVEPRFGLKQVGPVISDGSFAIESTDPALLALLNSAWATSFFRENSSSIGSTESRGRMRIKANILRSFPFPPDSGEYAEKLNRLRNMMKSSLEQQEELQQTIDELAFEIYEGG